MPSDAIVATGLLETDFKHPIIHFRDIKKNEKIFDVGKATSRAYEAILQKAGTIIWNGPIGIFEMDAFGEGTRALAKAIAASSAYALAGGGETLAAIEKYGVYKDISYVSTGGGAFLEYIEGRVLPAVAILEERAKKR